MSKRQKALKRLLSKPVDYNWAELLTLMTSFGYELKSTGGSGRKFVRNENVLVIHEPHPRNILKPYQVNAVLNFLRDEGDIE